MDILNEILDELFQGEDYAECDDFLEAGLLDSMDIMDLVESLESGFGIEISGRDILPENFANVEAIRNLLSKYTEVED